MKVNSEWKREKVREKTMWATDVQLCRHFALRRVRAQSVNSTHTQLPKHTWSYGCKGVAKSCAEMYTTTTKQHVESEGEQ